MIIIFTNNIFVYSLILTDDISEIYEKELAI